MAGLATEWDPKDYLWDPETLTAVRLNSGLAAPIANGIMPHTHDKRGLQKNVLVICQIEGCEIRLDSTYYRKYRICPDHAKSPAVIINGQTVRFCQKCARFHDLAEFDFERRSCRVRLAEHNKRRRQAVVTDKRTERSSSPSSSDKDNHVDMPRRRGVGSDGSPKLAGSEGRDPHKYNSLGGENPVSSQGDVSPVMSTGKTPVDLACEPFPATLGHPPNNNPNGISLDSLMAPLASNLHSWDQLMLPNEHCMMDDPALFAPFNSGQPLSSTFSGGVGNGSNFIPVDSDNFTGEPGGFSHGGGYNGYNGDGRGGDGDAMSSGGGGGAQRSFQSLGGNNGIYQSSDLVARLSLKLFSCVPEHLPATLRVELERAFQLTPTIVEGYLRPGCVHIAMDMRLPREVVSGLKDLDLDACVTGHFEEVKGRGCTQGGSLLQMANKVVATNAGKVLATVPLQGPTVPRLATLSPACVALSADRSARVNLVGSNIRRAGDLVLCREHGKYVTVELMDPTIWGLSDDPAYLSGAESEASEDCADSATSVLDYSTTVHSVRVSGESSEDLSALSVASLPVDVAAAVAAGAVPIRLLGLKCGVAEVEVQRGGVLTPARPLLVLPDAAAAAEVEAVVASACGADWTDGYLRDIGLVVGHLAGEGAAGRAPRAYVAALAAKTVEFSLERGCVALARLLQPALSEESSLCSTEADLGAVAGTSHAFDYATGLLHDGTDPEKDIVAAGAQCDKAQQPRMHHHTSKAGVAMAPRGKLAADVPDDVESVAVVRAAAMQHDLAYGALGFQRLRAEWGWVPAAATLLGSMAAAFLVRTSTI